MREIVDALEAQHAELAGLLEPLDDDGWQRPSPCPGWSVADVVLHLAQTDEMAVASVEGRMPEHMAGVGGSLAESMPVPGSVDDGAGAMVEVERGAPPAEVYRRWRTGATLLATRLRSADPHARLTWVAGELAARTLATTRLAETWIHTTDVAAALGVDLAPTDRLRHIARLAWRTVPYAFARAGRAAPGPVAFRLTGPDGSAWTFEPSEPAETVITGPAVDLCLLAGQRLRPDATTLRGTGPDAAGVLDLVRTYA